MLLECALNLKFLKCKRQGSFAPNEREILIPEGIIIFIILSAFLFLGMNSERTKLFDVTSLISLSVLNKFIPSSVNKPNKERYSINFVLNLFL